MRSGAEAESLAVKYLLKDGFKIVDQNWRTKFCEIDIIASKKRRLHFIEVKGRTDTAYGYGYEYITSDKARRLARAAEYWTAEQEYEGDYQIDVISIDGQAEKITYIPNAVTRGGGL